MKIGSVSLLAGAAAKPVLSRQDSGRQRGSSARGETAAIPLAAHPCKVPHCPAARDNHTERAAPSEGVFTQKDECKHAAAWLVTHHL